MVSGRRIAVTHRLGRLQVAPRLQVAAGIITIGEGAPIRRDHLDDRPLAVQGEANGFVAGTGDAAVADGELHAIAVDDAGDAELGGDFVSRTVERDQRVLSAFAGQRCRVVGRAGLEIVEATGPALQLAADRA
jgi:hypothetical protein